MHRIHGLKRPTLLTENVRIPSPPPYCYTAEPAFWRALSFLGFEEAFSASCAVCAFVPAVSASRAEFNSAGGLHYLSSPTVNRLSYSLVGMPPEDGLRHPNLGFHSLLWGGYRGIETTECSRPA